MAPRKKQPSIEDNFAQLDEIIGYLEQDDTPLSEALEQYSKGVKLLQACKKQLDQVEKQIIILNEQNQSGESDEGTDQ